MASDTDDAKQTTASGLRPRTTDPPGVEGPTSPVPGPSRPRSRYGAGDVIADKYRLGRKLGEGGMGEVWLAHNETLDIDVAIKLIRGEVATEEMADRLLHEARAAARLGHPAIVRVNDFGKTIRGDPFIVMELLDGEDLASALAKRGRLSAIKAVRTLLPIAHALTVAHTKGIVHRDLKPENIYLAKNDGQLQPKLVDFGVAKLEKQHSHRLTQSGALLGSPLYMSPEQARGDDVDHRADVWALAVVLYESIVGRPPFEGKNYNAVLYSITANPPAPITQLSVGDEDLWTILDRGFQKDPDRRWYSMRDFGEALARWLEDRNVHEDITGASLQTAWLSWKKEDDALGAGPSGPPPDEDALGALPPVPQLAPGLGSGYRQREITIRKPRRSARMGAAVLVATAVVALIVVLARMRMNAASVTEAKPAQAGLAAGAPGPGQASLPAEAPVPADPAHERAIEEALAGDPALAASAAAAAPAGSHAGHVGERSHAAQPPRSGSAKVIHTADPYRSSAAHAPALKNPFE